MKFTWGNKAKHCWVMSTNFLFQKFVEYAQQCFAFTPHANFYQFVSLIFSMIFFSENKLPMGRKQPFFLSLLVGTEIITNIRRFGIWDWWKHLMNSLDISFLSRTLVGSVESIAHHLWTKYYARKWGPSDINGFDIKMVGENQWHWFFFKSWQEHKKISLSELSNIGLFNHTLPWMTL